MIGISNTWRTAIVLGVATALSVENAPKDAPLVTYEGRARK